MNFSGQLKKTLLISVFWHLIIFFVFALSFNNHFLKLKFAQVSFLGTILPEIQVSNKSTVDLYAGKKITTGSYKTMVLPNITTDNIFFTEHYLKPIVHSFHENKPVLLNASQAQIIALSVRRKESVLMFYPELPYEFTLYFNDRQTVHIELAYKISMFAGDNKSIAVKRKISSGNLDADLLTMRYIGHYLFIQQNNLSADTWQTVKIDLSAKK